MMPPIIRSTTLTPLNSKPTKNLSLTPPPSSLKLKMFRLKDPLSKTRIKKVECTQTQPIVSTNYISTNLTQNNIYGKTKVEKLKEIQDIESCISALKSQIWHCKQFRNCDVRKEITPPKRSFTFFNREKIQREVSNQYLIKKGKVEKLRQIEVQPINPEHLEEAIKDKAGTKRKLEVRTILSNKIRGNLVESIKEDGAHEIVPRLASQEKSEWIDRFPEVKEVIVSKSQVKKRKYLKSIESRSYNPYYSFLAMPKHGRRLILSNFEQKPNHQQ